MDTMAEYLAELVRAGLEDRKAAPLPEGISVEEIVRISGENHMDYLLLGALLKTEGLSEKEKELKKYWAVCFLPACSCGNCRRWNNGWNGRRSRASP